MLICISSFKRIWTVLNIHKLVNIQHGKRAYHTVADPEFDLSGGVDFVNGVGGLKIIESVDG